MATFDESKSGAHNAIKALIANLIPGVQFYLTDNTAYYIHSLNGVYRDIAIYQEAIAALRVVNSQPELQQAFAKKIAEMGNQAVQQEQNKRNYNTYSYGKIGYDGSFEKKVVDIGYNKKVAEKKYILTGITGTKISEDTSYTLPQNIIESEQVKFKNTASTTKMFLLPKKSTKPVEPEKPKFTAILVSENSGRKFRKE